LAGYLTNSMGLISDAMESFVNLASAMFALAMVTIAERPADDDHPYGHHKAEYFSSGFEGILIVGRRHRDPVGVRQRLMSPQPLEQLGWGLALSVVSSGFNAALAVVLFRAARVHRSIALEADGRHLMTDVWTSAAVVIGIVGVQLQRLALARPAAGHRRGAEHRARGREAGVALVAGPDGRGARPRDARHRARHHRRLSPRLPEEGPRLRFDDMVTRSAGQRRFADLHMHVPGDWTLQRAADMRDQLEQALMDAVPGLRVTIQLLPLNMEARAGEHAPLWNKNT
jgi:divalent metal cation (Fe/Co/Zn/Cd) transporter